MMIENEMFWCDSQYLVILEGFGVDMIEEIKLFLDEDIIVVNGYKIFGLESNDFNF